MSVKTLFSTFKETPIIMTPISLYPIGVINAQYSNARRIRDFTYILAFLDLI